MTITSSQAADLEQRFTHLLQPIKDLTKNWEVDIASELEEYLDEIEKVQISFDGGATTMNFAEAALLIQGSACVYSRKVEYLYVLVCQVLDLLLSKKKQAQQEKADGEGAETANQDAQHQDDDEFLSLDDIKEHKNVTTKKDNKDLDVTAQIIPKTPLALVTLSDDTQKGEHPLLSVKGELLGSRKDFKMNHSNMHSSGTILLDLSYLPIFHAQFATSTPHPNKTNVMNGNPETESPEGISDIPMEESPFENSEADDHGGGCEDFQHEDGEQNKTQAEKQEEVAVRRSERKRDKILPRPAAKVVDRWQIQDPHITTDSIVKPFKKDRGFIRYSSGLENTDKTSKKRGRRKTQALDTSTQSIQEFHLKEFYSVSSKLPSHYRRQSAFNVFEELYWEEFKRRRANQKKLRRQMIEQGRDEELVDIEKEQHEDENDVLPAGGDDDDDEAVEGLNVPEAAELNMPDIDSFHQSGIADHQDIADRMRSHAEDALIVRSYEDLVREYVEGFMASAQEYAQITELSRRVTEWEEKILPTLEEEETHEAFDIHKYGTTVLDTCQHKKEWITFRKVVEQKPMYMVSRLFLATLQLANNYNVQIGMDGSLDKGMDTMRIKLLSTKRHFEELEEYRAPSVDEL